MAWDLRPDIAAAKDKMRVKLGGAERLSDSRSIFGRVRRSSV